MKHLLQKSRSWLFVIAVSLTIRTATADEGMWLFNDLPQDYLKKNYDFVPDEDWARHVMLSSVRFNVGGSASFVSGSGLVLTNHHVGADTLHKLSNEEKNIYRDGFYAETLDDEIKAPDLELNQLVSIEDVTDRVETAVKPDMSPAEAFAARRAVMAEIEKESLDKTKLRSDVVTLFGGGKYHLYRYKKYTDVRLVWSPESAIAFFGGDADNFEYPRYCLDVCMFRVYEDDKPAQIENFLKISPTGADDGELVFVSGNPGRTQRIFTTAALKYQRDHYVPYVLDFLRRREVLFQQFGLEGEEQAQIGKDDLFGIQNARKAYTGMIRGLQDPTFICGKQEEEKKLLAKIKADPELKTYAAAWEEIEKVQARQVELLGRTAGFAGRPYEIANTLVFMAAEDQKPSAERLREYRESARESLLQKLFSPAPIHTELERIKLADSIELFVERRGGDDPLVAKVLQGKSPQARAAELIAGTKLVDVDVRKKIAEGGQQAIDKSTDPLIQLAKLMEPEARKNRKVSEELQERERQAYAQITTARYAVEGTGTYPDATFTLRLAIGTVAGYEENGQPIPPWTTIKGAFESEKRHGAKEPWQLPESWHNSREKLNQETPFNFVSTNDIIGGNSGSPVINRQGEFVGIIFDGNIQSLTARYFYSDKVARAVSVHSAVIVEALKKVYGAERIMDELAGDAH